MMSGGYGRDDAAKPLETKAVPEQAPATAMQFTQEWKRCCATPEKKYQYLSLVALEPEAWATLFKGGVDAELLTDMFSTYQTQWQQPAAAAMPQPLPVLAALTGLSRTPRFGLTLELLTPAEVEVLKALCGDLHPVAAAAAAGGGCAALLPEFAACFERFLPEAGRGGGGGGEPDMSMYE
eukprot:SAG22_NODE_417_length_10770_cov_21.649049_8_plen_180_part_00